MRSLSLGHGRWSRLDRLLDMMYRPAEIASTLDISVDSFYRSYVPAGAPVVKDAKGVMWIHGLSFAIWARDNLKQRPEDRKVMADNEVYCLKCHATVQLETVQSQPHPGLPGVRKIFGMCPTCGSKAMRFARAVKK